MTETFGAFLDARAARFGDRLALASGDERWSYERLAREVWALQAGLIERGVQRGERVAVMLSSLRATLGAWARQRRPTV